MKIFITGSESFVGKRLTAHLIKKKSYDLFCVDIRKKKTQNYKKIDSFLYILKNIEQALPKDFQLTKNAINDYIKDMPKFINQKITNNNIINNKIFTHFKNWWGRGQQYSSFIKK
jgi:hypothetical protein